MTIQIYDNGGETVDRYTVVIEEDGKGNYFGMSSNPLSPQGFNQYGGDSNKLDYSHLGKLVSFYSTPVEVQQAIAQRLPAEK